MKNLTEQMKPMEETYYTVKEIAARFRVSRQTIYEWINDGRLRAVRVGTRTRITESAIAELVQPIEPGEPVADEGEE